MSRYLLDTAALLAHFRKEPCWEKVKETFDEPDAVIFIASVTLTELAASARAQSAVLVHRDQHMTAIPADLVDQILL